MTDHNRLCILPWHRGFQMTMILQTPLRARCQRFFILLQVESRDTITPGIVQSPGNFFPTVDINTDRIREEGDR